MSEASQPMFSCGYEFFDNPVACGCSLCTEDGSETFDCEDCLAWDHASNKDD